MQILILGGTVFLGRAIVAAALAGGHAVTLFNRGQSNPELFPEAEKLRGDRKVSLAALNGRRWDAVIDTSGYVPRVVRAALSALAPSTGRYVFISSISVYAHPDRPGADESAPAGTLADPTTEEVTGETYGPLKALCEQAVIEAMPAQHLILRPGLIVGPQDPTDRFTYWPVRVADGGEVLAPGRPGRPVQVIDVRNLAEWTVRAVETGLTGVYNAAGPAQPIGMGDLLAACQVAGGNRAQVTWVDESFLLEQGVAPWSDLPLWIPETPGNEGGMLAADAGRAIAAGLTFRPLAETARATLEWARTRPAGHPWRAGLSREREAELLAAWHARPAAG